MPPYEIRIKGYLNQSWSARFLGLKIIHNEGETILSGSVRDQAALRGLLDNLADLGLELISVMPITQPPTNGKEGIHLSEE